MQAPAHRALLIPFALVLAVSTALSCRTEKDEPTLAILNAKIWTGRHGRALRGSNPGGGRTHRRRRLER